VTARAWRWTVVSCATGLLLASCGVPLDGRTHEIASEDVPFELLDETPTTTTSTTVVEVGSTTTTAVLEPVYLYLVRNDRVERVRRNSRSLLGVEERVQLLMGPVTADERAETFRTAVPPASVSDVTFAGGVATVDLTAAFTEAPTNEQVLAFAQITYTVLEIPGLGQVAFRLEGVDIQPLDDEGTVVPGPATLETYVDLLAGTPGR
jgi:spore germination protein GerM